jgi:hypothetical protein
MATACSRCTRTGTTHSSITHTHAWSPTLHTRARLLDTNIAWRRRATRSRHEPVRALARPPHGSPPFFMPMATMRTQAVELPQAGAQPWHLHDGQPGNTDQSVHASPPRHDITMATVPISPSGLHELPLREPYHRRRSWSRATSRGHVHKHNTVTYGSHHFGTYTRTHQPKAPVCPQYRNAEASPRPCRRRRFTIAALSHTGRGHERHVHCTEH